MVTSSEDKYWDQEGRVSSSRELGHMLVFDVSIHHEKEGSRPRKHTTIAKEMIKVYS